MSNYIPVFYVEKIPYPFPNVHTGLATPGNQITHYVVINQENATTSI